jgi:hypothetical protein
MFNHQPVNITLLAAATLPQQYLVVQGSSANYGGLATAVTQSLVGIAQNVPQAGEHLTVCPFGQSRAVAGAAVTAYAELTSNGSGRVIAAVSGDSCVIGYALEAAGADGDLIRVWVQRMRRTVV